MSEEVWRPVPGFEAMYEVSDGGRVRSVPRTVPRRGKDFMLQLKGKVLRQPVKKSGHRTVMLYRGGVGQREHVHRLVLNAFIGPPPSALHECAHCDGDPSNNRLGNLRWATRASNHGDKVAHGTHNRGEAHPLSTVSDATVRAIRSSGLSASMAARTFGVSLKYASAVIVGSARRFS